MKHKTLIKEYFRKDSMNWHHGAAALGRASLVDLLMGKLHCYGSAEMENHQTFPSVSKGGCHIPL